MRTDPPQIFLTIVLGLLIGATTVQAHGNPVLKVDPAIVAAGGMITAQGSEMEPDLEFTITLERAGESITLGTATAKTDTPDAAEAMFSQTFTLPSDIKPGSYEVRATSPDGDTASADLTVTETTAAATTGPAEARMASGEPHILDRSKPIAEIVGLAVIAAILAVAGVWLSRRSEALT